MIRELTNRPATRRIAIACVVLLLFAGIVAIATGTGRSGGVGDARLSTKGHALITGVDGQRRTVTGTVALHRGETVESVEDTMTIELPDGSTVEGRPGFKTSDPTRVKVAQPVELLAGDLLVTATGGADVEAGGNRVHLDSSDGTSAARVSRSLAVGAAVFRGTATFDSAGQARAVPALRTLEVSALGRPPAAPSPLKIDKANTDPWERRFLGEAIDLGHTLDSYASVYTNTLGGNGLTVGAYKAVLPDLANEGDFTNTLLAASPADSGEKFIGAAIASLSRRGAFADRWRDTFSFRVAGANWGFVALDQGVATDPLLSAIQDALNNTQFQFALAAQTPPTAATAPPVTGGGPATPPTTPPVGGPTTTPPTTPPPTTVVPPIGSPLVDGIVKSVNDVLGGLPGARPPGG
ncbi:MAG: putative surface-exposed virulence protein [Acidimicrobiaceae bacterium]